jgi:hypothetical protein
MIPVVGGLKQWYELNTGKDAFTGEWLQSGDGMQAFNVVVNFLPVAFGPAALIEAGGEASIIGAGEQGLVEVGETEIVQTVDNIIAVDFTQGEAIATEATYNLGDVLPDGRIAGVA